MVIVENVPGGDDVTADFGPFKELDGYISLDEDVLSGDVNTPPVMTLNVSVPDGIAKLPSDPSTYRSSTTKPAGLNTSRVATSALQTRMTLTISRPQTSMRSTARLRRQPARAARSVMEPASC